MRKAGWVAVGIYILFLAAGMAWFGSRCEGLTCLGMIVLPSLPAILVFAPFLGSAGDIYFFVFYAVSIILNFLGAYWLGVLAAWIWRRLRFPDRSA